MRKRPIDYRGIIVIISVSFVFRWVKSMRVTTVCIWTMIVSVVKVSIVIGSSIWSAETPKPTIRRIIA